VETKPSSGVSRTKELDRVLEGASNDDDCLRASMASIGGGLARIAAQTRLMLMGLFPSGLGRLMMTNNAAGSVSELGRSPDIGTSGGRTAILPGDPLRNSKRLLSRSVSLSPGGFASSRNAEAQKGGAKQC
jgi:hypothetical protein